VDAQLTVDGADSVAHAAERGAVLTGAAELSSAIRTSNSPEVTGAELPVYSGLIETARANNGQGFPVGAAYLREASDLRRARILPAAGRLYAAEAQRLGDNQRTGTSTGGLVAVLIACVAALIVIVGAQVVSAYRAHGARWPMGAVAVRAEFHRVVPA
jgi:hypothetical protein